MGAGEFPNEASFIKDYLQPALLAESILGTTGGEMRFQTVQLINTIGSVQFGHLSRVLVRVTTNDHLRNLSELTEVLTV